MVGFKGHHLHMHFPDHVFPQDDSKVFCSLDFIKLLFSNSVAGSDGLLSPADSQSVTLVWVKLHTQSVSHLVSTYCSSGWIVTVYGHK